MNNAWKACSLVLLTLIIALSLIMVKPSFAQSLSKPSVPEFTLTFAVQSKDVPGEPPKYTIDPYTGQQKIQTPGSSGYHQDIRTVEIKVKNQPYTAHVDGSNYVALYYNVSYKGPYESDWHYYLRSEQSSSDYTLINFTDVPNDGGTIEFRVQAQIGYYTEYHMPFVDYSFHGEVSGWSSTQSVEVPAISQSSPNPTSQATVTTTPPTLTSNSTGNAPESQVTSLLLGATVGLGAVVAVLAVAVALLYRRIKGLEPKQNGV